MGRPSLYSDELLAKIVERLSAGEPLAQICRDEGMPSSRTVRAWIQEKAHVSAAIAHAREEGEDWLAAECLMIADTPREGVTEKLELVKGADGKMALVVTERKREDMLGHRKLQIETRLKLLAKWNPKKYGEKVEVGGHLTLEQLVAGAGRSSKASEEGGGE